jgi:molecular chaperone GrpE
MSDNDDARKSGDPQEAAQQQPEQPEQPESEASQAGDAQAVPEDSAARAEALAHEYKEQLLRTRAEAENQRKRMERESANAVKYAAEKVFRDLLAVVDSLELGLKAAREAGASQPVIEGIELTRKQLGDTLARHGVSELDPAGAAFDPDFHEAVSMVPSDEVAPNHVLEVVQKGYQLHQRVLRPARVVVASAAPPAEGEAQQGSAEPPSGDDAR